MSNGAVSLTNFAANFDELSMAMNSRSKYDANSQVCIGKALFGEV